MLIEFSVENFLSIKDRVTLSMIASDDTWMKDNEFDTSAGYNLLKSAVLYGANASGKTNVLRALEFMVELVIESHQTQKGDEISVTPYKLELSSQQKPSHFEVVIIVDGTEYVYGFSVDSQKVHQEYLYYDSGGQKNIVFERQNTHDYKFSSDHDEQVVLSKRTLENALYLSISTQFNYIPTSRVFQWFKDTIEVVTDTELEGWRRFTAKLINSDQEIRDNVLSVLQNSDIGIRDIEVTPMRMGVKRLFITGYKINTYHAITDDQGNESLVQFELNHESKGTQKMFELLGTWIQALHQGRILVMDELDTSLHPKLAEQMIKLFHDKSRNKRNAQLIFTTHNTNLLDLDIFRRDQIWFTEKKHGSTEIFSLYDFHDEHDDIERRYLVGRYGAVPTFREGLYPIRLEEDRIGTETSLEKPDSLKITDGEDDDDEKQ